MKRFIRLFLITLTLIGWTNVNFAQGESAVPFLLLAPDSRAGGIGESGAGLADNSAAIFWNPAGLAFLTGSEVSITHSNWLPQFNLDLFYDYLTYRQYIEEINGSVSASITYMNFGEFQRTGSNSPDVIETFRSFDAAMTLGYATKVTNDLGLGFNFRLIHSRLSDKGAGEEQGSGVATSVSFDIAAMWRPEKLDLPLIGDFGNRLSLGMNLSNLGPAIYYIDQAQADPIPTNLRVGLALRLFEDEYNKFTYTIDFSRTLIDRDTTGNRDEWYAAIFTSWGNENPLREVNTSMGIEYWYGQPNDFMFAVRAGYFYEDPSYGNRKFMTLGAGIRYDLYGFDFSYITTDVFPDGENHPLSDTLRFTLLIGWGEQPEQTMGFPRGL
ncbi:MAG: PorV/PorQ family protein [Melioribacteraceae bacterium]|nr:PorV/PorQ family protein [Melioribacteraceae bacterium]MCO6472679.1 PorV/PorQ family protein [Melioribacteraceae bacterium]MDD3559030.1 PorV/PorQ family protein [Melioribacteraceae bacterium]